MMYCIFSVFPHVTNNAILCFFGVWETLLDEKIKCKGERAYEQTGC